MKAFFLSILLMISSCSQAVNNNAGTNNHSKKLQTWQQSLAQWQQLKQQSGNSYQYSVVFSSWVGFGNKTTIKVIDDKVSRRDYYSWGQKQNKLRQWSETSISELGKHKEGAALKTMEQLYSDCHKILQEKIMQKIKSVWVLIKKAL